MVSMSFALRISFLIVLMDGALAWQPGSGCRTARRRRPSIKAAAMPLPSAMPPAARTGMLDRVADLRNQRHGGQLADMAAGLTALSDDREWRRFFPPVSAIAGGGDHRDYLDAGGDPLLHVFARVTRAGDDDRDLSSSTTRSETSSAKGLISMMLTPKGLVGQLVRALWISSRSQSALAFIAAMMSQTSGVADRRRQTKHRQSRPCRPGRWGTEYSKARKVLSESSLSIPFLEGLSPLAHDWTEAFLALQKNSVQPCLLREQCPFPHAQPDKGPAAKALPYTERLRRGAPL